MKYRFVFFDVDSTLVTIEGIDVLALNHPEIAALTTSAMNGDIPLDEVYGRRLEVIRPHREQVAHLADLYLQSLVIGVPETIDALCKAGVLVHLVTGGIAQAMMPLAALLNIPAHNVHAVSLQFNPDGSYSDFDRRSFLTRSGGKEVVVRDIRARSHGTAAFVGDGVSDLETKTAVECFIGFGGVVVRPHVQQNAGIYVTSMTDVLKHLV